MIENKSEVRNEIEQATAEFLKNRKVTVLVPEKNKVVRQKSRAYDPTVNPATNRKPKTCVSFRKQSA